MVVAVGRVSHLAAAACGMHTGILGGHPAVIIVVLARGAMMALGTRESISD